MNPTKTAAVGSRVPLAGRLESLVSYVWKPPLVVRYGLVAGIIGIPASIAQLALLIWAYHRMVGPYNTLTLDGLWVINFELGMLRNYVMHCAYTWRTPSTWQRFWHAHVAAGGASVIDFATFNAVVALTGIVPLAQTAGPAAGFVFNFGYNKLKTFANVTATKGALP